MMTAAQSITCLEIQAQPIYRWVSDTDREVSPCNGRLRPNIESFVQSSASRTLDGLTAYPSAKALAICRSVRFADVEKSICSNAESVRSKR
jgi:hypothetical protein